MVCKSWELPDKQEPMQVVRDMDKIADQNLSNKPKCSLAEMYGVDAATRFPQLMHQSLCLPVSRIAGQYLSGSKYC